MDASQYLEILENGVVESFEALDMEEDKQYFQQDNDPKHMSHRAQDWFDDNKPLTNQDNESLRGCST